MNPRGVPPPRDTVRNVSTPHHQAREQAALLIIDVQRGLFDRPTPVYRAESLLSTISSLAAAARAAGATVVYLRHNNKMLATGTEPWQLHPSLQPCRDDLVLDKAHGDAFEGTGLNALLEARGVGSVYVTGLVTEGCVRATCLGARNRSYRVILVSDAHSSFHRDAAQRIQHWNKTLATQLDGVVPAGEIDF